MPLSYAAGGKASGLGEVKNIKAARTTKQALQVKVVFGASQPIAVTTPGLPLAMLPCKKHYTRRQNYDIKLLKSIRATHENYFQVILNENTARIR